MGLTLQNVETVWGRLFSSHGHVGAHSVICSSKQPSRILGMCYDTVHLTYASLPASHIAPYSLRSALLFFYQSPMGREKIAHYMENRVPFGTQSLILMQDLNPVLMCCL